ncbi:hypothetical protein F0562_020702 [Nyssa sinensis]|uniref:Glycosyltransferase n=1 Tax=Nyssa sinensis TaxID=561372 RepID=A0A5J5BVN6_9ASTE|nr:hypothetical protein F0562_020702 [Nyssa sinensis]
MLQEPLEHFLQECRPHCLVADMFFPWATECAAKFGIPRLVFHGTSFFALCVSESLMLCKPYTRIFSGSESFIVPNLPDEITLKRSQLPIDNGFTRLVDRDKQSEVRSYGVIVNSFYELEPAYADHYQNVLRRKSWHIGPVSLCNKDTEDKAERGKKASIEKEKCLKWLNSKQPDSVLYVCFGSVTKFTSAQLLEIAVGLEASGQQFIWVVRKGRDEEESEKWLLEGFKERMKGKGLIIRGWAPQILILEHEAVGGFVTHCGWNSTMEGVCAGVPMVTWPVFAEQFHNEKLVTQILRIGVGVGAQQWVRTVGDSVKREAIEKAVRRIMVGEEAGEMRSRAKALAEMAMRAVEEGIMGPLHVLFFPLMVHGHMIPILDMAKLFALRRVKATIITTPLNLPVFSKPIDRAKNLGIEISVSAIEFPAVEAGLPKGCENADQLHSEEMIYKFFKAIGMLQEQLEHVLRETRPDLVYLSLACGLWMISDREPKQG